MSGHCEAVHRGSSLGDGDHVGGVPELAQLMPIGTFIDHGGVNDDAERVAGTLAMHKAYAALRPRAQKVSPTSTSPT
jgi:hypothetical protein